MKKRWTQIVCSSAVFAMVGIASANLLTNGDFALGADGTTAPHSEALGWSEWGISDGNNWNNREANANGIGGDANNYHRALGYDQITGDQGVYQTVLATAGLEYTASVDAGSPDGWWKPKGVVKIEFKDVGGDILDSSQTQWAGAGGDAVLAWANYSTTAVAPVGTTQITFLLMNQNLDSDWEYGGTMRFDNAVVEAVPEPATLGLVGLATMGLMLYRRLFRS